MALILQIFRETLKPGCEADYEIVEDEVAALCVRLGGPHPYLALEQMTGPRQVWWLNLFESEADRLRVEQAYLANRPLMAALEVSGQRKAVLTKRHVNVFASYRPDLSSLGPRPWVGARFLVSTITAGPPRRSAAVFETVDGLRYIFEPFRTGDEAAAAGGRGEGQILAVQPRWGLPGRDWTEADPEFWAINPSVRHGG